MLPSLQATVILVQRHTALSEAPIFHVEEAQDADEAGHGIQLHLKSILKALGCVPGLPWLQG